MYLGTNFDKWQKANIQGIERVNNLKFNSLSFYRHPVAVGSNKTVVYQKDIKNFIYQRSVKTSFEWAHATLPETIPDDTEFNCITKAQGHKLIFIAVGSNRSIIYSIGDKHEFKWHAISLDKFNDVIPADTNFTEVITLGKKDMLSLPIIGPNPDKDKLEHCHISHAHFIVLDKTKTYGLLLKRHVDDNDDDESSWDISVIKLTEDVLANMPRKTY